MAHVEGLKVNIASMESENYRIEQALRERLTEDEADELLGPPKPYQAAGFEDTDGGAAWSGSEEDTGTMFTGDICSRRLK